MNEAEASEVNNTQLPRASYLRPTISSSIKKDISLGSISERKSKKQQEFFATPKNRDNLTSGQKIAFYYSNCNKL